ncbi:MAG: SMP-30/gluconolactonase/LRE family protein [Kangiellaceae bacterium]|nr:SMP-30/gluconolactonase/LRE family protein [Kangiellaceae bacterium]
MFPISNKKKFFLSVTTLFALWLVYLTIWPVAIQPQAWQPTTPSPLTGQFKSNQHLAQIERLELTSGYGPEDVAVDQFGNIYGGLQDGRIIRFNKEGKNPSDFANTKGRPLGLHFDKNGNLIVADAYKGLLSINSHGDITVLTTSADDLPFRFTNDLDIADDGTIYFSDASYKFTQAEYKADALEHRPNGRLLAYSPKTRKTTTLLKDLYFANGVAISPDQSFLLINETWTYRVLRYWIAGEKKGNTEIFIEQLPGFPDGISSDGNGTFWLALASPRNSMIDNLAPHPWLRKIVQRLPEFLQPAPVKYAFVLGLNDDGKVVHNLQEPSGHPFSVITSVQAENGYLYFGSLEEKAIGRITVP